MFHRKHNKEGRWGRYITLNRLGWSLREVFSITARKTCWMTFIRTRSWFHMNNAAVISLFHLHKWHFCTQSLDSGFSLNFLMLFWGQKKPFSDDQTDYWTIPICIVYIVVFGVKGRQVYVLKTSKITNKNTHCKRHVSFSR